MEGKRKASRVDERMLRENEYIGRVLNEKVKEIDRLKVKFERKLQQEKEKFAVRHLSVTSNFNDKKATRARKISLAFESPINKPRVSYEMQNMVKSISDSQLSKRRMQDEIKMNCALPPIVNNAQPVKSTRNAVHRTVSEGVQSFATHTEQLGERLESYNPSREFGRERLSPGSKAQLKDITHYQENCIESQIPPEDDLPQWQRDAIAENRRQRANTDRGVYNNELRDEDDNGKQAASGDKRRVKSSDACQTDLHFGLGSNSAIQHNDVRKAGEAKEKVGRKSVVTTRYDTKLENTAKQQRTRKQSRMTKYDGCESMGADFETTDAIINLDSIARVNMVKNLTKQQRIELEHQVTFLPPMNGKFKDETNDESNENEKDTKRISMAKKRWLKAYDIAKSNFKGKGPKEHINPINGVFVEQPTPENCTKDPRLLELVSLLCKRHSICIGKNPKKLCDEL